MKVQEQLRREGVMKIRLERLKTPFVKGIVCGGVLIALLFISWRVVLFAAGILLLYFLVCKWK